MMQPDTIDQFGDPRDGYRTFHHLAAPKVDLYRSILRVFGQAKEHFEISLRPAEVVDRLVKGSVAINAEEVSQALEKLQEWRNLDASQDNSEVHTVEEFKRPRFLYQFTAAGEATEQALAAFDQHFLRPGELQTTALRSIQDTLDELERLLAADELDGAKAFRALRELTDRFGQLVTRAQSFMRTVQRSIDAPSSQLDLFLQHKEALLSYLERFVGELVTATYRVSTSLRQIEARGVERALSFAAETELADALQPDDDQRAAARDEWLLRWQGLRRWFLGQPDAPSQAEILRGRARAAIPALLETVRRLNDQRASRTDRATDFISLARWFATCPTNEDLHRLWRVAFGLTPARHLRVNDETQAAWEAEDANSRMSWKEAPPYYLTPRLRMLGHATPRGPVRAVIDRSADRARLAALAAEEENLANAARRTLATAQPRRLSELPVLTERELELLLDLLGEANASVANPGESSRAISEDGTLMIEVETPPTDIPLAVLETKIGTLRGPNFRVTITDLNAPAAGVLSGDPMTLATI
jgi:uncharacterized protein (TIGR02677 family)